MKHRKGPFSEDLRAALGTTARGPGPFRPAAPVKDGRSRR